MTILVTGGAGFIGSNFVQGWLERHDEPVVNLDKLTYAGNLENLAALRGRPEHIFVRGDICDGPLVARLLAEHRPRALINLAAESHVDRSICEPDAFVQTNIVGTFKLLECARAYWNGLQGRERAAFRYLQVSTDEVYGSLPDGAPGFTEAHRYQPSSPYSASKAAADHLVRACHQTYGLPVLSTHCSNNYGPYQFPEKLMPLCIVHALEDKPLPLYGDGLHVRDWLYVADHCSALRRILEAGAPGEAYNIGGWNEQTNLQVAQALCAELDALAPREDGRPHASRIGFVRDRAGHDRRYATDASKLRRELGWAPQETFASGIAKTVRWYLAHSDWTARVTSGAYQDWIRRQYTS